MKDKYQSTEDLSPIDRHFIEKSRRKYKHKLEIPPELLEDLARGVEHSFDKLYLHFYDALFEFINAIIRNDEDAKEIVHDSFTDLWIRRESLNSSKNIKGLIYTCARNNAFDYFKRKKVVERYHALTDGEFAVEDSPELSFIARDLEMWIQMTVANMPDQRKRVFVMNRMDGMSIEDIAQALNISVSVVKKHLVAARKDIRNIIPLIAFLLLTQ